MNNKQRLDQFLVDSGQVMSRSQAESYIKLGVIEVNGKIITKPGFPVSMNDHLKLFIEEQYVSRAALKLASVSKLLKLDFQNKIVLDVGSSTGGFTDYALKQKATQVIAVELGTNQLHPSLRNNSKIELYEKTNILNVYPKGYKKITNTNQAVFINTIPDIIVIDVSFVSLREILPHIILLSSGKTSIVAMFKPQFEAFNNNIKHKGVIKNDNLRRQIIKDFETWLGTYFIINDKADSLVAGAKGNRERFYLLHILKH